MCDSKRTVHCMFLNMVRNELVDIRTPLIFKIVRESIVVEDY